MATIQDINAALGGVNTIKVMLQRDIDPCEKIKYMKQIGEVTATLRRLGDEVINFSWDGTFDPFTREATANISMFDANPVSYIKPRIPHTEEQEFNAVKDGLKRKLSEIIDNLEQTAVAFRATDAYKTAKKNGCPCTSPQIKDIKTGECIDPPLPKPDPVSCEPANPTKPVEADCTKCENKLPAFFSTINEMPFLDCQEAVRVCLNNQLNTIKNLIQEGLEIAELAQNAQVKADIQTLFTAYKQGLDKIPLPVVPGADDPRFSRPIETPDLAQWNALSGEDREKECKRLLKRKKDNDKNDCKKVAAIFTARNVAGIINSSRFPPFNCKPICSDIIFEAVNKKITEIANATKQYGQSLSNAMPACCKNL